MVIKVPATSANLGPGFDSLGLCLSLFNTIEITRQSVSSISLHGEGSDRVSLKRNNFFVTIFKDIYFELSGKSDNFRFVFHNNIPFSRGLGSSSAVIIGAIASAFEMAEFKVDRNKILDLALKYENHPDNLSATTYGGFVNSIVENGKVYTQKTEISDEIQAVVVIPDKPISTLQSRAKLPRSFTLTQSVFNLSHASFLVSCFIKKDYDMLKIASQDMIHEKVRMDLMPELHEIRKVAYDNGALMSTLSGSGSSFLNLTYKDDAQRLKDILKAKFNEFRVEILSIDNNGFSILED